MSMIGDDHDEQLQGSLERARKLALEKQQESVKSGPQAIALLASSIATDSATDNKNFGVPEFQEIRVVFTEMDEFLGCLQFDEKANNFDDQERIKEDGGWPSAPKESAKDGIPEEKEDQEIVLDANIREAAVGKGLFGALKLLKDRGSLKESAERDGQNRDRTKSKQLVGIHGDDHGHERETSIERTDEYGRILTPKQAFQSLSHKFHGKRPGRKKQEKRMRRYQEELKAKQMKINADAPSLFAKRMREAQIRLKTPYLVLSGHVKPALEEDVHGGFTSMLGDHKKYLLRKRKTDTGDTSSRKKPTFMPGGCKTQ